MYRQLTKSKYPEFALLYSIPFLSLRDNILPLQRQTSDPDAVLIVKSSPESENAFSFMCKTCSTGKENLGFGPSAGTNGMSGAILTMNRDKCVGS